MIAAIENALRARIKAASDSGALGYRLRAVEVYAGQFDDELRLVARQFPAIWVAMRAVDRSTMGAAGWQTPATFSVFCAALSRRNQTDQRHGSAAGDVGVLQMVQDARSLLIGQTLDLPIDPLRPGAVSAIADGKEGSVYVADFHTGWVEPWGGDANTDSLADFATFHADWDLPPWDRQANASDTVHLPTQEAP